MAGFKNFGFWDWPVGAPGDGLPDSPGIIFSRPRVNPRLAQTPPRKFPISVVTLTDLLLKQNKNTNKPDNSVKQQHLSSSSQQAGSNSAANPFAVIGNKNNDQNNLSSFFSSLGGNNNSNQNQPMRKRADDASRFPYHLLEPSDPLSDYIRRYIFSDRGDTAAARGLAGRLLSELSRTGFYEPKSVLVPKPIAERGFYLVPGHDNEFKPIYHILYDKDSQLDSLRKIYGDDQLNEYLRNARWVKPEEFLFLSEDAKPEFLRNSVSSPRSFESIIRDLSANAAYKNYLNKLNSESIGSGGFFVPSSTVPVVLDPAHKIKPETQNLFALLGWLDYLNNLNSNNANNKSLFDYYPENSATAATSGSGNNKLPWYLATAAPAPSGAAKVSRLGRLARLGGLLGLAGAVAMPAVMVPSLVNQYYDWDLTNRGYLGYIDSMLAADYLPYFSAMGEINEAYLNPIVKSILYELQLNRYLIDNPTNPEVQKIYGDYYKNGNSWITQSKLLATDPTAFLKPAGRFSLFNKINNIYLKLTPQQRVAFLEYIVGPFSSKKLSELIKYDNRDPNNPIATINSEALEYKLAKVRAGYFLNAIKNFNKDLLISDNIFRRSNRPATSWGAVGEAMKRQVSDNSFSRKFSDLDYLLQQHDYYKNFMDSWQKGLWNSIKDNPHVSKNLSINDVFLLANLDEAYRSSLRDRFSDELNNEIFNVNPIFESLFSEPNLPITQPSLNSLRVPGVVNPPAGPAVQPDAQPAAPQPQDNIGVRPAAPQPPAGSATQPRPEQRRQAFQPKTTLPKK